MDANETRASDPGNHSRESDRAELETQDHRPSTRGELEVRCPNCHASMDVAVDTQFTDLTCASCGSHFSLVDQSQATRMAPSLSQMGRFELIERLGVGSFGSVWKARDKELDRTVAIKIPRQGGMTAVEQEKFFREARAAAQLRHPSIVSVHEVGRDGDSVYIVSDFVRGVTLGDWLTGQQLTSREAAELCAKIADALEHAHEKGIVHRDLKPANIIMDGDGEPHLMDFGLARRDVGEVTVTMDGQVVGTPAYMSPEQAEGRGHDADRRSDVYSLGVILFQLLTGELPFRGNARMLMHQVINDEPPSPRKLNANVAKDLETITLKCLEKDSSRRYQSAAELTAELKHYLAGEPIRARPIGGAERAWRWVKRNRRVAALTASVGVLLVAIAALSTVGFAVAKKQQLAAQEAASREANLRGLAEENLKLAKEAVDGYLTRVAEDERLKQDDFHKLRTELLETAVPFYERFSQQKPGDSASRADQANAYARLASIHATTGQRARSVEEYRRAIAIQKELVSELPNSPQFVRELANNHMELGWALQLSGKRDEAKPEYQAAISLLSALLQIFPEDQRGLRILVPTYQKYGILLRDQRDPGARSQFEQAVKIASSLVEANAQSAEFQNDAATSLFYLGHYFRTREPELARAHLTKACEILRNVLVQYPRTHEYRTRLAESLSALGNVLSDLGDIAQSKRQFEEAIAIQKQVVVEIPSDVTCRVNLATMLSSYAIFLEKSGDLKGAMEQRDQCISINAKLAAEFPDHPSYAGEVSAHLAKCAELLKKSGDKTAAKGRLEQACIVYEKQIAPFSELAKDRLDACARYLALAALEMELAEWAAARKHHDQVLQIREQLTTDFPENSEYRAAFATSLSWVAWILATSPNREFRDPQRAVELATKACQVTAYEDPQHIDRLAAIYEQANNASKARPLYEKTLAIFVKQAEESPENLDRRYKAASQHARFSAWLEKQRDVDAALKYRQLAASHFDKLTIDFADKVAYRSDAAYQHEQLARLLEQQRKLKASQNHAEQRLAILEKAVADFPQSKDVTHNAVNAYWSLMQRAQQRGDQSAVRKYHQGILDIWASRVANVPDDADSLNSYAHALLNSPVPEHNDPARAVELATKACELTNYETAYMVATLGYGQQLARNLPAAKTTYERAIALYDKRLATKPDDRQLRLSLAYTLGGLAGVLTESGELAAACDRFEQSVDRFEKLATDFPDDRSFAEMIVNTHGWLGDNYERQEDWASARTHRLAALKTYDDRLAPKPQDVVGWLRGTFGADQRRNALLNALKTTKARQEAHKLAQDDSDNAASDDLSPAANPPETQPAIPTAKESDAEDPLGFTE